MKLEGQFGGGRRGANCNLHRCSILTLTSEQIGWVSCEACSLTGRKPRKKTPAHWGRPGQTLLLPIAFGVIAVGRSFLADNSHCAVTRQAPTIHINRVP